MNWQQVARQQGQKRFRHETEEQFIERVRRVHKKQERRKVGWRKFNEKDEVT